MSNLSDTKKPKNNSAMPAELSLNPEPCTASVLMPTKSNRWSFIQNDLTQAMQTWQELENAENGISPEEEQLAKIKIIIEQLKAKLEQF